MVASFPTVFRLRPVPMAASGTFNLDVPWPSG